MTEMKTGLDRTVRRTALLAVVALFAASCSGDAGGPRATTDPRKALRAEVASYDLAAGDETRFTVGLFTGDELFVSFGSVELDFSYLGERGASGEPVPGPSAVGRFLLVPGADPRTIPERPVAVPASKGRGVYAAEVSLDSPGFWEVEVTADIEDRGVRSATAAFSVLPEHRVPAPGERAIPSDNLTVDSKNAPSSAVDSGARGGKKIPDSELHEATVAQAMRRGRPALVVFSTPVYCVSRFCGPITDMVQELARDYSDRAEFIHVEIWRNFEKGVINEAAANWLLRDDDLREPWVFLIGSEGRIAARWDNVATRGEIEPLLRKLPEKGVEIVRLTRPRPPWWSRTIERSLWVGLALALSVPSSTAAQEQGDPQRGREVFEQNCAMCHGSDASGMMGMHPSLRGAIERLSQEGVEVTIRNGRDVQPPMPAFEGSLSDEDISDVIAYLDSLPAGPRNFGPGSGMMDDGEGMMGRSGADSPGRFPWLLAGVLAIALIGIALVFAARSGAGGRGGKSQALHILEERYARGDIDHEEFEERRRTLSG